MRQLSTVLIFVMATALAQAKQDRGSSTHSHGRKIHLSRPSQPPTDQ